MRYEHTIFRVLEIVLRTMRREDDDINLNSQKSYSNVVTHKMSPRTFEVSDLNNTLDVLINGHIFIDNITLKSRLKRKNILQCFGKSVFITILKRNQIWVYEPNTDYISRKNYLTAIDKLHSKCDCIDGSIMNGIGEFFFLKFCFRQTSWSEKIL